MCERRKLRKESRAARRPALGPKGRSPRSTGCASSPGIGTCVSRWQGIYTVGSQERPGVKTESPWSYRVQRVDIERFLSPAILLIALDSERPQWHHH